MKRKTLLKSVLVLAVLSTVILAGGCKSMGESVEVVKCPTCDKTVSSFHPKKGRVYKKVACPTCKNVVTVNDQKEVTGELHLCKTCDALVAECPTCASK